MKKPLAGRDAQVALNLAEALDDHDDVQNVFADFDISDEELAHLASAVSVDWHAALTSRARARSGHAPLRVGRRRAPRARACARGPRDRAHRRAAAIAVRLVVDRARAGRGRPRAHARPRRASRPSSSRRTRRPRPSSGTRAAWRCSCARGPASRSTSTPPALVKRAVAGSGRAEKAQVAQMVRVVLGLRVGAAGDAADALAVAVTHLQHIRMPRSMQ